MRWDAWQRLFINKVQPKLISLSPASCPMKTVLIELTFQLNLSNAFVVFNRNHAMWTGTLNSYCRIIKHRSWSSKISETVLISRYFFLTGNQIYEFYDISCYQASYRTLTLNKFIFSDEFSIKSLSFQFFLLELFSDRPQTLRQNPFVNSINQNKITIFKLTLK